MTDRRELIPAPLPSGRRLLLETTDRGESLVVVSPGGSVELSIELTPTGPVLRLQGARLEIDSTESVALKCKSFELQTQEELRLHAGSGVQVTTDGEVRMKSAQQTYIDADYVNLNCLERTGYHDEGVDYGDGGDSGEEVDSGERDPAVEPGLDDDEARD
ncbi:MAG: hypothetical protein H6682_11930 [Candidatus Eisenbacteria bacterium]|nr:hypothetical protein [Candidatus Eisenbacteria bacterium]